ncbi:hypothetical protein PVAG01_03517 [Phlyctema vagabunda]|uniref:Uncharacterized protein n=1 Tax=Phlyctema vagabunda TaxID=108571 RepID=A0ABR4PMT5_9HELO
MFISKILYCLLAIMTSLSAASPLCHGESCQTLDSNIDYSVLARSSFTASTVLIAPVRAVESINGPINKPDDSTLTLGFEHVTTDPATLPTPSTQPALDARSLDSLPVFEDPAAIVNNNPGRFAHTATALPVADGEYSTKQSPSSLALPVMTSTDVMINPTSMQTLTGTGSPVSASGSGFISLSTADLSTSFNTAPVFISRFNTFTAMWNGTGPRPYGGGFLFIPSQTSSHRTLETSFVKRQDATLPTTSCTTDVSSAPQFTRGPVVTFWNATMASTAAALCSTCLTGTAAFLSGAVSTINGTAGTTAGTRTVCATGCRST